MPLFFLAPGHSPVLVVMFWVLFYGWLASELWTARRRLPGAGSEVRDRGSAVAVVASMWVGLAIALACAAIPWTVIGGRARTPVFVAGLLLVVAGVALRQYSIHVLGRSFTVLVATHAGQRVVESGPYRWIRHPSYTGGLLSVLGIVLCATNLVSFVGLLPVLLGYAYRIRVEEAALLDGLGDSYGEYMRRTRRLVPFIF